ncbi:bifunctional MaoC family dehydratase N-terminal/OB-fold nucleic acid binding domain-containing protein [Streptomyces collinus]
MSGEADPLGARLRTYEGRPAAVGGVGKDPVNTPMIRHWCEAMGDTCATYRGPDATAPPTMLQVWTMGGLSGHDGRTGAYDELLALLDESGCTSVVATDCEQEYLRLLRPGDQVTFDAVIESVSGRKSTKLGTGYFVTTRMDVRVGGDLVGTHRFRILKYAPTAREPRARRPRPVVNRDNAGFWEGVAAHRLLVQRCVDCGTPRHPWLPGCNACGCLDWDTVEARGEGTVYSYVVMHHPPSTAFSEPGDGADPGHGGSGRDRDSGSGSRAGSPYVVGLIELAEGVRMLSNVVGVPPDKVRIGLPVRVEFRAYEDAGVLPVFRVAGDEG